MAISVIVSNFNGEKWIPKLLETLQAQKGVKLEIIVVDRQSRDNSLQLLAKYPSVIVTSEPPESGLVCGYDSAVKKARYEHLFFCNEDMWFEENCLQGLEARIDLSNRVAVADPFQWSYDGATWIHGITRFRPARFAMNTAYPRRSCDFLENPDDNPRVPFPCAGAFLIHRSVYEEIGGWDRSFFLDFEDMDLGIRLWQHGWHSVAVPDAKVHHAVGASNAQQLVSIKSPVSRRRYISGRASVVIMGLKYFSGTMLLWPVSLWWMAALSNLCKLRFQLFWLNCLAFFQILDRLPDALAYRGKNRELNRSRRPQEFFLSSEFAKRGQAL